MIDSKSLSVVSPPKSSYLHLKRNPSGEEQASHFYKMKLFAFSTLKISKNTPRRSLAKLIMPQELIAKN